MSKLSTGLGIAGVICTVAATFTNFAKNRIDKREKEASEKQAAEERWTSLFNDWASKQKSE